MTAPTAALAALVRLYNAGYAAGHHHTVEGGYADVLPVDAGSYHADVVAELLADPDYEALAALPASGDTTEIIYIGDHFYWEAGTAMSSIYSVDGRRYDWGFVQRDLRAGKAVTIRQATSDERKAYVRLRDERYPAAPTPGEPT